MANPCKATTERITKRIGHMVEMLSKFDKAPKKFLDELQEDDCDSAEEVEELKRSAKDEFVEIEELKKSIENERDILDGSRFKTDGMRETYLVMSKAFVDLNNRWKSSIESFDLFAQQAMELSVKVESTSELSEHGEAEEAEIPIQDSKCSSSAGKDTVECGIVNSAQKNPVPGGSMADVESADNVESTDERSISSNGKKYSGTQLNETGAGEANQNESPSKHQLDFLFQAELEAMMNLQLKD